MSRRRSRTWLPRRLTLLAPARLRWLRGLWFLALALLTCATLITCAVLLFLRRPRDRVALLFSFAFLMFAAAIDPPLRMWLSLIHI